MAEDRKERFQDRWATLAVDSTLPLEPAATMGAPGADSSAFDRTVAASSLSQSGKAELAEIGASLPRISLGGSLVTEASSQEGSGFPDLQLTRTLGEGGMGRVHEANQRSLRRHVAVKTLKDGATAETRSALLREARVTGFLEHPGIIPIHSLGLDERGNPILVMKRVQGVPWCELFEDEKHPAWEYWLSRHGDRLLVHLEILSQVCDAVHFAHSQGIVHRDIKPENVMLGEFGEVYVVDWGLAIREPDEAIGQLVGTPAFMAPEMAMGEPVDARTDVYLLGATLHQILTGGFLHRGNELRALLWAATESVPFDYDDAVPDELANLANAATERVPGRRPPSADAVRGAIADYLAHRNSIAVSDAAEERLSQGERLLERGEISPEELAFQLGTHGAEARFGFEQALDAWPENADAARGLAKCLAMLVEAHILRRDPHGASAQLALMDDPPAELEQKIGVLRDELEHAERERARLHMLDAELDERRGLSQRIKAFVLIVAGVLGVSIYFLLPRSEQQITHAESVIVATGFLVISIVVAVTKQRTLLSNAFNRRIVTLILASFVSMVVNRLVGWKLGTPVHAIFSVDLLMFATVTAIGGVTVTRWIMAMSPVALAGVLAMTLAPEPKKLLMFSIFSVGGLLVGAVAWIRSSARNRR